MLGIEEMYLAGKLRIDQLVTDQLQIDEIAVRGAKLRLVRQTDGQWNARVGCCHCHTSASVRRR